MAQRGQERGGDLVPLGKACLMSQQRLNLCVTLRVSLREPISPFPSVKWELPLSWLTW